MLIQDEGGFEIAEKLRANGYIAYYAGGCIRDAVLERPYRDIDIATDALAEDIVAIFDRTVQVGAHFGVVKVIKKGREYDIATFRKDIGSTDGRHPDSIEYSTPQEDALRRDITINGLFYDPVEDRIIDHIGGLKDLERKCIRAIGDPEQRIEEDRLRLLRIVRFASVLEDFTIEEDTFNAVKDNSPQIKSVSIERCRDELSGILGSRLPARGVDFLIQTGLMQELIPEIMDMKGVPQPPEFHPEGDVLEHVLLMLRLFQEGIAEERFNPSETISLAVLLHDIGKPDTFREKDRIRFSGHCVKGSRIAGRILKRLKYQNSMIHNVKDLIAQHMKFIEVENMKESTLKRFIRQDNFDQHLILHWLDCMGSHRDLSSYDFCVSKLEEFGQEEKKLAPEPLLNGNDLIEAGYKPGPKFSEILMFLEDLQLEGKVKNREQAMQKIEQVFPPDRGN